MRSSSITPWLEARGEGGLCTLDSLWAGNGTVPVRAGFRGKLAGVPGRPASVRPLISIK